MAHAGRIIYVNHDEPAPAGGVRVIYSHVQILRRHGFPAYVLHNSPDFSVKWFEHDVPLLYFQKNFSLEPNDVLVIPENYNGALEAFRNAPVEKILFCQNHFYLFNGLGNNRSFADLGIQKFLSCSTVISDFLRTTLGCQDVTLIHNAVDLERFRPQPKKLQIACMPRKRPIEVHFIEGLFKLRHEQLRDVPWRFIHGVTEAEAAAVLAESAVFFALGRYEGLGLPPLEAMASGCAVVGFHGDGGLEYATDENGYWCRENDFAGTADTLAKVVEATQRADGDLVKRIQGGVATAQRYTRARQEEELLRFWTPYR